MHQVDKSLILGDNIVCIIGESAIMTAPIKRMIDNLKNNERLIDICKKEPRKTLIIHGDGWGILTAISLKTIYQYLSGVVNG